MRRDVLRLSGWVGIVVILMLIVVSGCTRSKSSGPPEATSDEGAQAAPTQPSDVEASSTPSGEDPLAITATAWAIETATAEAASPQETQPTATATLEPTSPSEATSAPTPTATPTSVQDPTATQAPTSTQAKTHTVQSGENLFRIALKYGLTYQELAAHNGIANPNIIIVGQVLNIPAGGGTTEPPAGGTDSHTVQSGENLYRIALKYNMLYTVLAAANDLSYPYIIYPGQKLIIP